jgi:hypothetical protein
MHKKPTDWMLIDDNNYILQNATRLGLQVQSDTSREVLPRRVA